MLHTYTILVYTWKTNDRYSLVSIRVKNKVHFVCVTLINHLLQSYCIMTSTKSENVVMTIVM